MPAMSKRKMLKAVLEKLGSVNDELRRLSKAQKKSEKKLRKLESKLKEVKAYRYPRKKKSKLKKTGGKNCAALSGGSTPEVEAHKNGSVATNLINSPAQLESVLDAPDNGIADDLKLVSGIGPKLEQTLNGLGVYHFHQIAAWKQAEIDWVDDYLNFSGRIERDNWIGQAKALAKGGWDEYVKVFGKEPR